MIWFVGLDDKISLVIPLSSARNAANMVRAPCKEESFPKG